MATRLHVTFTEFGTPNLEEALAKLGIDEKVISLPDDLGYGRLDPAFEHLALDPEVEPEWSALSKDWDDVMQSDAAPLIWFSRRCVRDLAGCMEFVSRCSEPPNVIDIADTVFIHRGKPQPFDSTSLAALTWDQVVDNRLLEQAKRMSDATFENYRARWATLKQENAPLRVLDETGTLVSAPITYFDELVLSCASTDWRPAAQTIADAIVRQHKEPYRQCGDNVLISRMYRLIDEGQLDGQGLSTFRDTRVRRRTTA